MLSSSISSDCSSLSSSSSISASSPISPSFSLLPNNRISTTQKTMEEVWKDITVNSLPTTQIHQIHTIHHPAPTSHFRGMILQDFLNEGGGGGGGADRRRNPSVIRSSIDSSPSPTIRRTTEFQFFQNEMMNSDSHQNFQIQRNSSVSNFIGLSAGVAAFDALANSSVLATFGGGSGGGGGGVDGDVGGGSHGNKKRFSEGDEENGCVDRRHKRMIKNRESAARSRARKQAYITELELEVDNLTKENAMLRKQQRQIMETPVAWHPKKRSLYRTSTAPF